MGNKPPSSLLYSSFMGVVRSMWKGRIYKLKPNKAGKWKQWCHQLMTEHYKEAYLSLEEEHCSQELWAIFDMDGVPHTLGLAHYRDGDGVVNRDRIVNKLHELHKKECFAESPGGLEVEAHIIGK